jgi:hypothetical protein
VATARVDDAPPGRRCRSENVTRPADHAAAPGGPGEHTANASTSRSEETVHRPAASRRPSEGGIPGRAGDDVPAGRDDEAQRR